MGRKKSPTRKHSAQRYVDPEASRSSSSASEMPSRLDNVSPSSLRGLAATKEEMDTESSSDGVQLPSASFQGIRTALPIGDDAHKGRENRRKRRSSGDDAVDRRQEAAEDSSGDEERHEVVTISVAELEKWQQRVILHIEDHFTNEQLKRIAEFGRVHGSVVQEAKQYVSNMEVQLKNQFEEERAALRAQAEEFVAKTSAENAALRRQVEQLERQVDGLEKQVDVLEKEKLR
ncbi:1-(5-phosphoribosyl)-5-amino-4-imidazole-carboxylate carboxylase [Phytophthora cinnamomi]|uniref:1-(5-phosphoribosyl)-5-amino-4-imidazole- carboxylate carboxylase n=1 Tax=Phytophthora cinnamomi TaxID=4785 RepID=UPI00355A6B97|nr:1-(5-phosphoribosyl)-5-amino-4-imidazole-carboxylate carboxylase [Phytophthora cinnamomi]